MREDFILETEVAETLIDPKQVKDLVDLIKRVDILEKENKAYKCIFKGFLVRDFRASIDTGAEEEANRLPQEDQASVKAIIKEVLKRG